MQEGSEGAPDLFAAALRQHRAGRVEEADMMCRQILAIDSRHADTLHLRGLIAYQRQSHDIAVDLISQAIAIDPRTARYHSNLGLAFNALARLDEAAASHRRALALEPDLPQAYNNLGVVLQQQDLQDEAAACFRRALDLKPEFPEAWGNLGNTLKDLGAPDEAAACYRRALELKPDFAELHNNLGSVLKDQGRLDEAIACYRRALDLRPDYAEAWHNLGGGFLRQGRFGEAFTAQIQALRFGNDPCLSYYELSCCRRFTRADHTLIAEIESALQTQGLSGSGQALLHFALGKISDDLGEYESAIRHFDQANRLQRGSRVFDASKSVAFMEWSIATSQGVPQNAVSGLASSDSELPIFIVGMPRSGTTLVEQILASHPGIAAGGEIGFWTETLQNVWAGATGRFDAAASQAAIRDYLDRLADMAPGALRVTDKMPHNFMILGHLSRLFPRARIIHCRRNPTDTALSIYFTRFTRAHDYSYSRRAIVDYYREYSRLMEHWRAVLPSDRFIEIDYENLVAVPDSASRRLVAFCGLEWDDACLASDRTERPISTASAWQARQPIYRSSAERWRHYEPWLGEFRELPR